MKKPNKAFHRTEKRIFRTSTNFFVVNQCYFDGCPFLSCGTPSHHTIARVAAAVDPKQFQKCFIEWMQACHQATKGDIIAVDGKTVRGSYDKGKDKGAIHMVSQGLRIN